MNIQHPKFKGVDLKHLITGQDTGGRFSLHLVRIEEGCAIGDHVHATQYELHEVVEGTGECRMADKAIAYLPGLCTVIPEGVHHSVIAHQGALYLLATFVPPLL
jgi:quercetin dioxygenase-like cupin family protein